MLDLLKYSKYRRVIDKNILLKESHKGEKVVIVGNGPSLNEIDPNIIKANKIITMNHFELYPEASKCNVLLHCIGEPYRSDTWEDPFNILMQVPTENFLFRYDAVSYFEKIRPAKEFNIFFYLPCHGRRKSQDVDLTEPALHYQSTSQMAIAAAIYMGFSEIYLVGFDHNWLCTKEISPHFYEERAGVDKADFTRFTYLQMINISKNLFEKYELINNIVKKRNVKIYNSSPGSYLDIFPFKMLV
jgi:hypothetical protein